MQNPLLSGNQPQNGMMQLLKALKSNPQQALQQMMMNNPKMQEVNNLIKQYGSPEQAFRHKAQEMGVNPDDVINLLKSAK